jgi:flagellar hook-length control protein FliK
MELNALELLLSNIQNLPSKTNRIDGGQPAGFNKILEELKIKFQDVKNNLNGLEGKKLPEAVKNDLLGLLGQLNEELGNLTGKEENLSYKDIIENQKTINSFDNLKGELNDVKAKSNITENFLSMAKNSKPMNMVELFKNLQGNLKNDTEGKDSIEDTEKTKKGDTIGNLKAEQNISDKSAPSTKNMRLLNLTNLLNGNNRHSENNIQNNTLKNIKTTLNAFNTDLNKLGEEFLDSTDGKVLQNLYNRLEQLRDSLNSKVNDLKSKDFRPLSQVTAFTEDESNLQIEVKKIIENSLNNLTALFSKMTEGNKFFDNMKNPSPLTTLEQFNKQKLQSLLLRHNQSRNGTTQDDLNTSKKLLVDKLFDGEIKKIILNTLNNGETAVNNKSAADGSNFNFINPTKVDTAFKETFLDNKKDKNRVDSLENKTKGAENSNDKIVNYKVIKEANAKNSEQQIQKEMNSKEVSQPIENGDKVSKPSNVRIDYMTIENIKNNKDAPQEVNGIKQKDETMQKITEKITDYIKFIKQENISKAELRLNLENLGKLKILFTDSGEKMNAKIFTDNDNMKHLVAMAFDNIKDNLVQKGINLSQYDFYHFNRDNQEQERKHNSHDKRNNYQERSTQKIEEKHPIVNALYA